MVTFGARNDTSIHLLKRSLWADACRRHWACKVAYHNIAVSVVPLHTRVACQDSVRWVSSLASIRVESCDMKTSHDCGWSSLALLPRGPLPSGPFSHHRPLVHTGLYEAYKAGIVRQKIMLMMHRTSSSLARAGTGATRRHCVNGSWTLVWSELGRSTDSCPSVFSRMYRTRSFRSLCSGMLIVSCTPFMI